MKNKLDAHHSLALYAVAIFLIIIGVFLSEYNPPVNKVFSNPSPTISETTNLTTKNILFLNPMEFKTRNYSPDDYFMQNDISDKSEFKKYPKLLLNISEDKLQKFRCSRNIVQGNDTDNNAFSYVDEIDQVDKLILNPVSDKAILKVLKNITRNGETIRQARYCEIANSNPIIYYALRNHEQANQRKSGIYFDAINEDLTITTQVNYIDSNAGYYFTCGNMLQVTTTNEMYIQCGGGDVNYSRSINIVDFNAGSIKNMYRCTHKVNEEEIPTITCETPTEDDSIF